MLESKNKWEEKTPAKMKAEITSSKEEDDDPPDSLAVRNRLRQKKSLKTRGTFFIHPIFKTLKVEIVSDINRCFELWQEFSPQKTLFDTWEFRFAFYLGYKPKLHFILLKNQLENLALLPLWYERDKGKYFWFGSWWQEENHFLTKDPALIPIMLSLAPKPLLLNAIAYPSIAKVRGLINFQKDDPKYVLNLENLKSSEDYLMKLKKNRRRNLRKDRNRILKQDPKIVINDFSDFEYLVRLSKERFRQKGETTDWEDPRRVETFRQVIKLDRKSYKVRTISVWIKNQVAGADLIALLNNRYYTLKCGYDVKNFPGIGNFINLFEIDDAISLGMKRIDFLQNNYQWKNKLLTPIPLLKYEK